MHRGRRRFRTPSRWGAGVRESRLNCPCSVRECLPTSPNPDQPRGLRLPISYGLRWARLVPVAPAVALITQRSLVQIQPPQPRNSTGYGTRRSPLGSSGNVRRQITATSLIVSYTPPSTSRTIRLEPRANGRSPSGSVSRPATSDRDGRGSSQLLSTAQSKAERASGSGVTLR